MNKTLVAFTLIIATSLAAITTNTDLSSTLSSSSGIYVYGTTDDKVGNSISNAGDFNKDGVEDFLVGTSNEKAYLVFGTSTARSTALDLSSTSNAATSVLKFTFTSTTSKLPSSFAVVVSAAGDMDKDGYDDIAFGIPTWIGSSGGGNQADAGMVLVYYGTSNTAITTLGYSVAIDVDVGAGNSQTKYFIVRDSGSSAGANKVGTSIASGGDVARDSNNADDLIIGAPVTTGFVYVIKGTTAKRTTDVVLSAISTNGVIFTGPASATIGLSVAGVGDVNGDGYDDIVIGGLEMAFLIYGSSSLADTTLAAAGTSTGVLYNHFAGPSGNNLFGQLVGSAGDINNDGANDFFVGSPHGGTSNTQGKIYIIAGIKTSAQIADLTSTTIANQIIISGPAAGAFLGQAADGGADINNDDVDDIVVCAPYVDWTGGSPVYTSMTGKCYVIYGKTSFPSVDLTSLTLSSSSSPAGFTITGVAEKGFGRDVSVVGDVSGDSGDDFIISASEATGNSITTAGNVFVFYGVAPTTTSTGSGFRLGASFLVFVSFFAALMF